MTGGAGFIGSYFIHYALARGETIINVDKLSYASNRKNLLDIENSPRYFFEQADILNREKIAYILGRYKPSAVLHFAAETHVDHSIDRPDDFISNNILGTYTLLSAVLEYWRQLPPLEAKLFRFHQISTDEVYGELVDNAPLNMEGAAYCPSSPYSASKAAADHLVRAWFKTYGLPVITSYSSNNYGPKQYPDKLIPLIIKNALASKPLPIYGRGEQLRDWLFVEDHVAAIYLVLTQGVVGEGYHISANNSQRNIDVVIKICEILDDIHPNPSFNYKKLINFVDDRLGHDRRYGIDSEKLIKELGWKPMVSFDIGLRQTISWYISHKDRYP
ncbi:dTDP-glucose 4,6-dehydratase [Idiomarina xiamenensis]|uniref:dTDP-glucose 4,6-dehydratase n=1 Tax=Idiomarina xiamenensis 10-D-4 TaxID=740709 RepID=K2K3E1_9GAMM|nr:dTDP-glucose 4,6-dehydratase [Idiomarina xiamenensis]EKE82128.1 dTDP-glucose 4,6-dehydratase [Idiomarina xiamenensis 10-D-4]